MDHINLNTNAESVGTELMSLRKSSGNMYSFVSHTWNPIKGKCFHDCSYCYMKRFKLPDIYLDEKELKIDLGKENFIFVGSGTDMFAKNVPAEWITMVLNHCKKFENKYLFQTKNPAKMIYLFPLSLFPSASVFGTTIETNRHYENIMFNAPTTQERATYMSMIHGCEKMLTIEPIMDFDEEPILDMIKMINPFWINIGADSKGHNLPEPSANKIYRFIETLIDKKYIVKIKSNLRRICPEEILLNVELKKM